MSLNTYNNNVDMIRNLIFQKRENNCEKLNTRFHAKFPAAILKNPYYTSLPPPPPPVMKYIGFKHQRENKQNSDKHNYHILTQDTFNFVYEINSKWYYRCFLISRYNDVPLPNP
jgi:hypothetical protein